MVTDAAGEIVSRRDFFPFGEQIAANSSSGRNGIAGYNEQMGFPQLFTAKERDDESGLDYFLARYYSGALGRFTSADAPFADQHASNPQSWNLYQYGYNNPLANVDIDGRSVWTKIAKVAVKIAKEGNAAAAFADNVEDADTLFSSDATPLQRVGAGLSLISELAPVSAGDVKDVARIADGAIDAGKRVMRGTDGAKRTGRGKNRVDPDPKAEGPHSVPKRDANGNVTGYTEFAPTDPRNPNPFEPVKRYDGTGREHTNSKSGQVVPTPHVNEKATPGGVRPPRPEEIPKRREDDR